MRAFDVHEFFALCKRRFAVGVKFHVIGKFDGQIFIGHGHDPAFRAVHDGNGRAPVALAGNQPVAETVVDFFLSFALFGEIIGDLVSRVLAEPPVELQAVDADAVLAEGEHRFARFVFDDFCDGKIIFLRESEISLVVRGNAHHRARTVGIQHVIGGENRHFFAVDGVDRVMSDKYARLFAGR